MGAHLVLVLLSEMLEVGLDVGQSFRGFAALTLVGSLLDRLPLGSHLDVNVNDIVRDRLSVPLVGDGGHRHLFLLLLVVIVVVVDVHFVRHRTALDIRRLPRVLGLLLLLLLVASLRVELLLATRRPFKVTFRSARRVRPRPLLPRPRSQCPQPGRPSRHLGRESRASAQISSLALVARRGQHGARTKRSINHQYLGARAHVDRRHPRIGRSPTPAAAPASADDDHDHLLAFRRHDRGTNVWHGARPALVATNQRPPASRRERLKSLWPYRDPSASALPFDRPVTGPLALLSIVLRGTCVAATNSGLTLRPERICVRA